MHNAVTQHIPFDMSNEMIHSFVYKNPLLAWTDCQSSFTCHTLWTIHNAIFCSYATQKHLDSKTILVNVSQRTSFNKIGKIPRSTTSKKVSMGGLIPWAC